MRPSPMTALLASTWLSACADAASLPGPGLDLDLRVADGQLQRGRVADDDGGPAVTQVSVPQREVARGEAGVVLEGRLAPGGVAVHLQSERDDGHWVVGTQGFDFVVPDELRWHAELELSYAIAGDQLRVRIQAADSEGRLGPVTTTHLDISPDVPEAELLVSLGWDAPVDLDLSLELPDGTVVGAKNIHSGEPQPSGQVVDAEAWMNGAWLDFDSNQQCRLDLVNRENIVWLRGEPPAGRYRVFAHMFSACGADAANFVAVAERRRKRVSRAGGTLYDFDARVHPEPGEPPGLLVMEFKLPGSDQ